MKWKETFSFKFPPSLNFLSYLLLYLEIFSRPKILLWGLLKVLIGRIHPVSPPPPQFTIGWWRVKRSHAGDWSDEGGDDDYYDVIKYNYGAIKCNYDTIRYNYDIIRYNYNIIK